MPFSKEQSRNSNKSPGEGDERIEFMATKTLVPEIRHVGWTRFRTATAGGLAPHVHAAEIELCYVVSGNVEWFVGEDVYALPPQHVFLTRPGERHGGVDAMMQPCEIYWIQVDAASIPEELAPSLYGERLVRAFPGKPHLADLFSRILSEHLAPRPESPLVVAAATTLLLVETVRLAQESRPREVSPAVREALRYFRRHLSSPPSVQAMAEHVGLSTAWLTRLFVRELGESPAEATRRVRLREARRLLAETELSVTEISIRLGYGSSQYLATGFRRDVGMSPTEYRAQAKRS